MEKNKQSQKKNETPKRKKSQRVSLVAPILKKKTIQLKIKISKGNELTQKDTNESKI